MMAAGDKRGGARPGSGRKKVDRGKKRVQMVVTVSPETREHFERIRQSRSIRPGQAIDYLMEHFASEL